jgi:hypothetical protein
MTCSGHQSGGKSDRPEHLPQRGAPDELPLPAELSDEPSPQQGVERLRSAHIFMNTTPDRTQLVTPYRGPSQGAVTGRHVKCHINTYRNAREPNDATRAVNDSTTGGRSPESDIRHIFCRQTKRSGISLPQEEDQHKGWQQLSNPAQFARMTSAGLPRWRCQAATAKETS